MSYRRRKLARVSAEKRLRRERLIFGALIAGAIISWFGAVVTWSHYDYELQKNYRVVTGGEG